MQPDGIRIQKHPSLEAPILVAGFKGWANALEVASGTIDFLIETFRAEPFASLDADRFFRYDENRPHVAISRGILKSITLPEGIFFAAGAGPGCDLILFRGDEPQLQWNCFAESVFVLLKRFGGRKVITLGSMYDNVLHTDRRISGISTPPTPKELFEKHQVEPIAYSGPTAVHSVIQFAGQDRKVECMSLWSHCPVYLQGVQHFGMIAAMGALVADLCGFGLDVTPLETRWRALAAKVDQAVDQSPALKSTIQELERSGAAPPDHPPGGGTVISLRDFITSRSDEEDGEPE